MTIPASASGAGNGLYDYVASPTKPTLTYIDSEYWLSPQYQSGGGTTTTTTTPTTTTTTTVPPSSGAIWNGAWQQNTLTATSGTPVTMSVSAVGASASVWNASATPANLDTATAAVVVGVKFTVNTAGTIDGIRIHRGAGYTATQVKPWTTAGTLLGTATIAGSGAGWVTGTFTTPIAVTAATTYVASYFGPAGKMSYDAAFFNTALTVGPITLPSTSSSGGNGVYVYTNDVFPTSTWNANNYWIDPIFTPASTALTPPARYNMLAVEIRGVAPAASNGIYIYSPDGVLLSGGGAAPTFQGTPSLGWAGQAGRFTEPGTGGEIIEMGARPYIPALGRFLGLDPIEGGSCNDYDYTCGDLINSRDTNGLFAWDSTIPGCEDLAGCIAEMIGRISHWPAGYSECLLASICPNGGGGVLTHAHGVLQVVSVVAGLVAVAAIPVSGGGSVALYAGAVSVLSGVAKEAVDPKPCRAQRTSIAL